LANHQYFLTFLAKPGPGFHLVALGTDLPNQEVIGPHRVYLAAS
jgi:hypothetical protein